MAAAPKTQGPASYFPSIEVTYGRPVNHRLAFLATMQGMNLMEMVAVLTSEHDHRASLRLASVQEATARGRPLIAGFGERFVTRPVGGSRLTPQG